MESLADQIRSFLFALGLHMGLIALFWLSAFWVLPQRESSAAGEPVRATLQVSADDIRRAQAAIKAVPKPAQPVPAARPETSDTPLQMTPQAPVERPDTVDQQRISRLALEHADQLALEEQLERQRQEQVDLTEDIVRQRLAERRQRLRDQFEAITREREAATRRTQMEEQRLQQLADMQVAAPRSAVRVPPAATPGNRGDDDGLLARYKAAMQQTADQNWNHLGAPRLTHCKVRFTQIPGGDVIDVEFVSCPYDGQGRESVERALRKTPMPYSGFEPVFPYARTAEIDFCHPREDCTR